MTDAMFLSMDDSVSRATPEQAHLMEEAGLNRSEQAQVLSDWSHFEPYVREEARLAKIRDNMDFDSYDTLTEKLAAISGHYRLRGLEFVAREADWASWAISCGLFSAEEADQFVRECSLGNFFVATITTCTSRNRNISPEVRKH